MTDLPPLLARIAEALERLAPPPAKAPAPSDPHADASVWIWDGAARALVPVLKPRRVPLGFLLGVDGQKARLLANTERFAAGLPANHALLWGARGAGKSALVKAVHAAVAATVPSLKLVELARADVAEAPRVADVLAKAGWRAILFIDDLSFERGETGYKALKPVLDGGVSGAFADVVTYVTSNRRQLVNRAASDAEDFRADETMDEQVSLSDRFGLWLGFHPMDQATWLAIVTTGARALGLDPDDPGLERWALQWSAARGARSGRSAWQCLVERAGALGRSIEL
jgi:predicted AAA+ superfamily ATPase